MTEPIKGFKKAFDDARERGETRCPVCLSAVHSKEYHENAARQEQAGVRVLTAEQVKEAIGQHLEAMLKTRNPSYQDLADRLNTLLATAPPEQAASENSIPACMECFSIQAEHKPGCSYGKQPQAASGRALSALIKKWRNSALITKDPGFLVIYNSHADDLEAALAAHDQKVREAILDQLRECPEWATPKANWVKAALASGALEKEK